MNSKGFFSLLLLFAFVILLARVQEDINFQKQEILKAKAVMLQAEKANYLKTELEQNTDFIIEKTIERELKNGKSNPAELQARIVASLELFFKQMENEREGLTFYHSSSFLGFKKIGKGKKEKFSGFGDWFKTIIVNVKENAFLVEFEFTGGILKDNLVFAMLESKNQKQAFAIPTGYKIVKLVVK